MYSISAAFLLPSDIEDSFVGPCGACRQVLMEVNTRLSQFVQTFSRSLLPLEIGLFALTFSVSANIWMIKAEQRMLIYCSSFLPLQFGSDWTVYLTKPDGSYKETSLRELLPLAFSPEHLAKK